MAGRIVFARDPFGDLERHMTDVMNQLLRRTTTPASYQRVWAPRVDIFDDEEEYVAIVELAGVDQEAVTVEVEDQEVAIVGERAAPSESTARCEGHPLQLEIPYGPFERRFVLPEPVESSQATASFRSGLLEIRLPKRRTAPMRVQVRIESRPR